MEDLLYSISSLFGTLKDFDSLSPDLLPLTGLFSGSGALILSKFTGSIGGLTLPINCSALFLGAMGANWLLQNVKLPVEGTVEAPLLISMLGMTVAACAMMWWMQDKSRR